MTERKPPGMSFETWVDSQIRQAEERGAFADLPGAGRPLPRTDRPEGTYEWALRWARRENGGVDGMLPPGLQLRKEREELPDQVLRLASEDAVRALVEGFNARVADCWRRPQEGPPIVPRMADLDALLAHWRANRPPPLLAAEPPEAPEPPARRRWWRRLLETYRG